MVGQAQAGLDQLMAGRLRVQGIPDPAQEIKPLVSGQRFDFSDQLGVHHAGSVPMEPNFCVRAKRERASDGYPLSYA